MKKLTILWIAAIMVFASCGEQKTTEEAEEEVIEKREVTPELLTLISDLAACEEQNTNCDAYTKAGEGVEELVKDEAKKDIIVGDLVYIIRTGTNEEKQAAAHALNFWTYASSEYRENAEYGKQILEVLKTIEEPADGYQSVSTQIGQLLSNWWLNEDEELRSGLIEYISDKQAMRSGRSELIRLVANEVSAEEKTFAALVNIANDVNEEKVIRNYAATALGMIRDKGRHEKVCMILEALMTNPDVEIAGNAMRALGYQDAVGSLDAIINTLMAHRTEKRWYTYGSGCFGDLIRKDNEALDKTAIFNAISELLNEKSVEAYYRSYYISPLHQLKTPAANALFSKLKRSQEEDIAKEADRVSRR